MCAALPSGSAEPYGLSPQARTILETFAPKKGAVPTDETGKTSAGKLVSLLNLGDVSPHQLQTQAKAVMQAFQEASQGFTRLSAADVKLVQRVIKQLKNPESTAAKATTNAKLILAPENKATLSQAHEELELRLTVMAKKQEAAAKSQLGKASPRLQEVKHQVDEGFRLSEQPEVDISARLQLGPHVPEGRTASQNYRIKVSANLRPEHSTSEIPVDRMETIAIAKPIKQGISDRDAASYGLVRGQEIQGECLTSCAADLTELPVNVPKTVALPMQHHFFDKEHSDIAALPKDYHISETRCMKLIEGGAKTPEAFNAALNAELRQEGAAAAMFEAVKFRVRLPPDLKHALQGAAANIKNPQEFAQAASEIMLEYLGIPIPAGYDWGQPNALSNVLQKAISFPPSASGPFNPLQSLFRKKIDSPTLLNSRISDLQRFVDATRAQVSQAIDLDTPNRWDKLFNDLIQPPQTKAQICSVQEWIPGGKTLMELTREEQDTVSPLSYARIAMVDLLTVQTDRNAGNILTVEVHKSELEERLHKANFGLPEKIAMRYAAESASLAEETNPQRRAQRLCTLGDTITSELPQSSTSNAKETLALEFEIHQYLHLLDSGRESYRDCIPIDNAICYPNPSMSGVDVTQTNNAWATEDASSRAILPKGLRRHLVNMKYAANILPRLRMEQRELKAVAGASRGEAMQWSPAQENLSYLTTRILQIGARMNKTPFEMSFLKDASRVTGVGYTCPLNGLLEKHLMHDGEPIRLENISERALRELDTAIIAEYNALAKEIGSVDDGFAKWNALPGLAKRRQLDETRVYQRNK